MAFTGGAVAFDLQLPRVMRVERYEAKIPFDIPKMFSAIRRAIRPFAKAMLFELYDQGHRSPFEQLVACVLSIRTLDETSLLAAQKLLHRAKRPEQLYALDEKDIHEMIHSCTFAWQKTKTLVGLSEKILREYDGETPCDFEGLTDLPGIGPKCANLVLGIACGEPRIGVDIHVHRVTNRWGYAHAKTPEKTLPQLEAKLPKSKWVEINELLVPFGKHICTGVAPKCSTCPVLKYCHQVGVTKHR